MILPVHEHNRQNLAKHSANADPALVAANPPSHLETEVVAKQFRAASRLKRYPSPSPLLRADHVTVGPKKIVGRSEGWGDAKARYAVGTSYKLDGATLYSIGRNIGIKSNRGLERCNSQNSHSWQRSSQHCRPVSTTTLNAAQPVLQLVPWSQKQPAATSSAGQPLVPLAVSSATTSASATNHVSQKRQKTAGAGFLPQADLACSVGITCEKPVVDRAGSTKQVNLKRRQKSRFNRSQSIQTAPNRARVGSTLKSQKMVHLSIRASGVPIVMNQNVSANQTAVPCR